MITAWIIQPQIDKLAAQKKQLDSLRVDIKVQIILVKRELAEQQMIRAQIEFKRFVRAINHLSELFQHFKRQAYPKGGFKGFKDNPIVGIKQGEYIHSLKKININGNN